MFGSNLSLLLAAAAIVGVAHSQCYNRVRPYAPARAPCGQPNDIATLVQLAKALNDLEVAGDKTGSSLNVDEIIMKLVNALIYTTASTRSTGSSGTIGTGSTGTTGSGYTIIPGSGGSGTTGGSSTGTSGSSNGLVGELLSGLLGNPGLGIRLLGPDGQILDITSAKNSVLNVGLDGGLTSTVSELLS